MAAPVTVAILIVVAMLGVAVTAWVFIPAFQGREAAQGHLGSHRLEIGAWLSVIVLAAQLEAVQTILRSLDQRIMKQHRANEASRRLETIPGIGIIGASAIAATFVGRRASNAVSQGRCSVP